MLTKSIIDCPQSVRDFLRENGFPSYDDLANGQRTQILARFPQGECAVSLYVTARGDRRIWFNRAKNLLTAGDFVKFGLRGNKLFLQIVK